MSNNCKICQLISEKKQIGDLFNYNNKYAVLYFDEKYYITPVKHISSFWELLDKEIREIHDIIWQLRFLIDPEKNWNIKVFGFNNEHVVFEFS